MVPMVAETWFMKQSNPPTDESVALLPLTASTLLGRIPRKHAAEIVASRAGNRVVVHTHGGSLVRIHVLKNELTVRGRWERLWSFVEDPNPNLYVEWSATELARLDTTVSPGAFAVFYPNGALSVGFNNLVNGRAVPSTLSIALRLFASHPLRVRTAFAQEKVVRTFGSAPGATGLHYASHEFFISTHSETVTTTWQVQEPEGFVGKTQVNLSFDIWRWTIRA